MTKIFLGQLLSQDSYTVGSIKGIRRILLHAVMDTYSSNALGFLHTARKPEAAVALVHNDVLPSYDERDIAVKAILTDNWRAFYGTEIHPFELYLTLNEIEHRCTKVRRPKINGFVERFLGTVQREFFELVFRRSCKLLLMNCKPTWMNGWSTSITSGRIRVTATWAGARSTASSSS